MIGFGLTVPTFGRPRLSFGGGGAPPVFDAAPTASLSAGIEADGTNGGTGTVGTISGAGSVAWNWQRDGVDIPGAGGTGETVTPYVFVGADVGALIRLRVTASNGGASVTAHSGELGFVLWHPQVLRETAGRFVYILDPLNPAGFWRDTAKTLPVTAALQFINAHESSGLTTTQVHGGNGFTYGINAQGRRNMVNPLGAFALTSANESANSAVVGGKAALFCGESVLDEFAGTVNLFCMRVTARSTEAGDVFPLLDLLGTPGASGFRRRVEGRRALGDAVTQGLFDAPSYSGTVRATIVQMDAEAGTLVGWTDGTQRYSASLASSGSLPPFIVNLTIAGNHASSSNGMRGNNFARVIGAGAPLTTSEREHFNDWLIRRTLPPPSTGATQTPVGV